MCTSTCTMSLLTILSLLFVLLSTTFVDSFSVTKTTTTRITTTATSSSSSLAFASKRYSPTKRDNNSQLFSSSNNNDDEKNVLNKWSRYVNMYIYFFSLSNPHKNCF